MPELPEVTTIVNDLNESIKGKTIIGLIYCDAKKLIREPSFERFKKEIKGKKIEKIERRAKNIIIYLSGDKLLTIHLKMTGHIIVVSSKLVSSKPIKDGTWIGEKLPIELQDPRNQFIHIVLELSGGLVLAYSDVRKFGEWKLVKRDYRARLETKLGPEPLATNFNYDAFKRILDTSTGKIKAVLMDQKKISGIGNIYGDEILFVAGVRPDRLVKKLKKEEIKKIYNAIRPVLEKAIKYRGSSESDFRDAFGRKGHYQEHSFVYRKEKNACGECGGVIRKIRVGQRSAHYCTKCQK